MLGEKRQAIKLCSIIIIYLKLCFRWEGNNYLYDIFNFLYLMKFS